MNIELRFINLKRWIRIKISLPLPIYGDSTLNIVHHQILPSAIFSTYLTARLVQFTTNLLKNLSFTNFSRKNGPSVRRDLWRKRKKEREEKGKQRKYYNINEKFEKYPPGIIQTACISRRLGRVHNDTSVFCELSVKTGPLIRSPAVGSERISHSLRGQHTQHSKNDYKLPFACSNLLHSLRLLSYHPHSGSSIFDKPLREKFASAVCVDGLSPRSRTTPEKRTIRRSQKWLIWF